MYSTTAFRTSVAASLRTLFTAFSAAVGRLDKSFSPADTIARLQAHEFAKSDAIYIFHIILAIFWLTIMEVPSFPSKLLIPLLYTIALLVPFTSQFFLPATPIFAWLLAFYTNRFIPADLRPAVHVVLLPTLESVLYGANISDILTRFTHPVLDIIAWLPYGVIHYTYPLVLSLFIWLFRPPLALKTWAKTFGYMNLTAVLVQILVPCAAPWYEVIYGLTPATYDVPGSAGGLARIDALFGGDGYQTAFSNSPLVFGAFPSLHAGWATLGALFITHFWDGTSTYVWTYVGVLYWSTMYLTHHYLIDVVGGACLATAFFYLFMPNELRAPGGSAHGGRSKYALYDLEARRPIVGADEFASDTAESADLSDEGELDHPILYRSPNPTHVGVQDHGGPVRQHTVQVTKKPGVGSGRMHRHTASIASLIRADERSEGWSPIGNKGFVFPPVSR
ncbi:PAP2-domain-containing protein [Boletus reticuloceps]|uniref:PAP2-domain-containing protein n=1 Tax=Boletus reticuloceps TaxID=495285 RepID=A0A8I2YK17_9AGAM|nr:PAP2-domain-containing protein [Boletus reticuloceps]